ncbi:MAG: UDP-2,4-diacetamido-2,4,6-trideoxy-beta-L-altropyranose hydrolase [Rhodocyclales bacterium]|nr:UDP-2,4-diacetamido-2,4,6-trideoxy-beta-L-altropyranose hydrolase [Rhodocyclales bacterium]
MRVVIRTDASPQIGTGHLARCQSLADMLQRRGADVTFICRHLTDGARERLAASGHEVRLIAGDGATDELPHSRWLGGAQDVDAAATRKIIAGRPVDWLVVDHYALDQRWECLLRDAVARIMVIDDLADRNHDCDLLVDQNLHEDMAERYDGRVPARARRMLGPRHALLRPEFAALRGRRRDGSVRRVLVFFGGVDAGNQTGRVLRLMPSALPAGTAVDAVIGAAHPHRADIVALCQRLGYACHVQTPRMGELMAAADLAIGAGGTAIWERCCVGLPAVCWALAENQRSQVDAAARLGLLHAPARIGTDDAALAMQIAALCDSPGWLQAMAAAGGAQVDGAGVARVCRAMGCSGVELRRATAADSERLFGWRNREAVRRVSRNSAPIERAAHEHWLAATLARDDRCLLVGERDGQALGVVRFDIDGDAAEVSIYLAPGEHGAGAGGDLLAAAERWLLRNLPRRVCTLLAEVADDNAPSRQMFVSAGYRADATCYLKRIQPDE